MFVLRNLKINLVKFMELNYFVDDDLFMCVYKFNCLSIDLVIVVEMKFFYLDIKFMVVVRYDKKLIVNYYDFVYNFLSLMEVKKMKKCFYLFIFVILYVFINLLLIKGQNGSDNGIDLVILLVNVIVKQFYLGVKILNKDDLGNVNISYVLRIYLFLCKMFNEDKNIWMIKGCKVLMILVFIF